MKTYLAIVYNSLIGAKKVLLINGKACEIYKS